jgi:hypothetical protein
MLTGGVIAPGVSKFHILLPPTLLRQLKLTRVVTIKRLRDLTKTQIGKHLMGTATSLISLETPGQGWKWIDSAYISY